MVVDAEDALVAITGAEVHHTAQEAPARGVWALRERGFNAVEHGLQDQGSGVLERRGGNESGDKVGK